MPVSRRTIITRIAALGIGGLARSMSALAKDSVIAGAIRWDAWYGTVPGSSESFVNGYVDQTLSPPIYRSRAPWFAKATPSGQILIDGDVQAIMDMEIGYASGAGLKYWAYCWYGVPQKGSPMQNAWKLHQSSAIKDRMNWCMILQFSRIGPFDTFVQAAPTWVSYLQQSNYQKVQGNRPLVYLYMDSLSPLNTSWHNDWKNVRAAIDLLRKEAASAKLNDPYIVLMYGNPFAAADIMSQVSADAISSYSVGNASVEAISRYPDNAAGPGKYGTFEASVEADWRRRASTGVPFIPTCMTNWDTRPRRGGIIAPGATTTPHFREDIYIEAPSPMQLETQIQNCVNFIHNNLHTCPSKTLIIYSWDECDEGGSALIPAYGAGSGPNTTYLEAVRSVAF